jgi:hypothetical protein
MSPVVSHRLGADGLRPSDEAAGPSPWLDEYQEEDEEEEPPSQ